MLWYWYRDHSCRQSDWTHILGTESWRDCNECHVDIDTSSWREVHNHLWRRGSSYLLNVKIMAYIARGSQLARKLWSELARHETQVWDYKARSPAKSAIKDQQFEIDWWRAYKRRLWAWVELCWLWCHNQVWSRPRCLKAPWVQDQDKLITIFKTVL